jgi:hypothetical protein
MGKFICFILVASALAGGAFAQTSNPKYSVESFAEPPDGPEWGDTVSVAADGKGSILVFRRLEPPVLVFNREGKLLKSWGTGVFPEIHSIDVFGGFVWVTDTKDHMVYKFTIDGQQLLALGTKGVAGDNASKTAFNRPTDVAIAPNGDIFVSDGYGNSRTTGILASFNSIKMESSSRSLAARRAPNPDSSIHPTRSSSIPKDE